MIRSMTGFGRAKYENEGREYIIEIKSVNHKYCDISVRIPRSISYLEEKVKKEISNKISRGKIEVNITFNNSSMLGKNIKINKQLAKNYIEQLKELVQETNIINDISAMNISKMPDVLDIQEDNDDEEKIWYELNIVLLQALDNFINMRELEGNKLCEDMKQRINFISDKISFISEKSTRLIEEYVVKLETRIKEILKTDIIDETRLAQEVVIYSDKCSVEEEITRLKSHVLQLNDLLNKNEYIVAGKRLDFIVQEMNREINTIGSKSGSVDITNSVIDMKTELENIREQIQNIE